MKSKFFFGDRRLSGDKTAAFTFMSYSLYTAMMELNNYRKLKLI